MEFSERKVACRKIDTVNASYRISTADNIEPLVNAIAAVGLIQPPVVVPAGDGFVIVSGHRRVLACMHLGLPKIAVRIPEPLPSALDLVRLAVSENSSHRQLNPIEMARSVALLKPFYATLDGLAAAAKDLSLPTNPEYLKKLVLLATLPEPIQEQIVEGRIAPPTALDLIDLDSDSALALADLFGALQLSLSKQREVMNMAKEVAARDEVSVAEVIGEAAIKALFKDEDLDRSQKSQQLRLALRKRRFPSMVEADRRYMGLVKSLPLGKYWRLTPPRYFESQTFEIKGVIGNLKELEKAKSQLEKLICAPEMEQIFSIPRKLKP